MHKETILYDLSVDDPTNYDLVEKPADRKKSKSSQGFIESNGSRGGAPAGHRRAAGVRDDHHGAGEVQGQIQ